MKTKNMAKKSVKKKCVKKRASSSKKKTVTQEEITSSALSRIKRLEDIHTQRKREHTFSDTVSFWSFLFISLITNFFLSFVLVFLIIFLRDPMLYLLVSIIGLAFGMVYSYMIHNLRSSLIFHHIYAKVFILLTGAINIVYIVVTSKIVLDLFGVENTIYSHLGISLTYFIAYILPYFLTLIYKQVFGKAL